MKQKRPRRARGVIDFTKPNRAIIDAYDSGLSEHGVAMKLGIKTNVRSADNEA